MTDSSAFKSGKQDGGSTAGERVTLSRSDVEIMLTCAHQVRNRSDGKFHQKLGLLIDRVIGILEWRADSNEQN